MKTPANTWTNNHGQTFTDKHDAFEWLNTIQLGIDNEKLYCLGELRFTKTALGIYSHYEDCYIKGDLPV